MATNSVPTIYDLNVTLSMKYGIPLVIPSGTTLNDKFGIGYATPPNNGYPNYKYLVIGNGGHQNVVGKNTSSTLIHSAYDSALANHLPFIVVPASNDLTPSQMANYRARVPVTKGGVNYFAYYIKVLDLGALQVAYNTFQVQNGIEINQAVYTPSLATQTPNMIDVANIGTVIAAGRQISTSITSNIGLSIEDAQNIINACHILYGDPNEAIISEMGLVAGFDTTAPATINGIASTYTEIQAAQIMNFISLNYNVNANPNSVINTGINIGMTQPITMIG